MPLENEQPDFFDLDEEIDNQLGFVWGDKQIALLESYHEEGYATAEIAKMMKIKASEVSKQKVKLGLGVKVKKKRSCLVCGNTFMSEGIWNRQCNPCRTTSRAFY